MAVPTVSSKAPELTIPAPKVEGWLARIRRLLVGDDVFISYARKDASRYALALATELTKEKLSCFLDQWGAAPHASLPPNLTERLRRSSVMVVVASPAGAQSTFVAEEIAIFRPLGRPVVLVSIDDAAEGAPWWPHVEGLEQGEETPKNLADATPAPWVFAKIRGAVGFHTRRWWLRKGLYGTALLLGLAVVGVVLTSSAALRQDRRARALGLANQAAELMATDPAGALRTALIAMDEGAHPQSHRVLSDVLRRHDRLMRTFRADAAGGVSGVAFSPDGTLMVAIGEERRLRFWDVRTMRELPTPRPAEWRSTTGAIAFSPDGQWLLSGGSGNVAVWRVADRTPISATAVIGTVTTLAVRPDGLVALNGHGKVPLLRLGADGRLREAGSIPLPRNDFVQALAFHPRDGRMTIGAMNGVYLADAGQRVVSGEISMVSDSTWVEEVAFSPDGRTLAVSEANGPVTLWSTDTWRPIGTLPHESGWARQPVGAKLAFRRDGTLLTGSSTGLLRAFARTSLAGDALLPRDTVGAWPGPLSAITVSPDGRTLMTASWDGMVALWSLDERRWLRRTVHPGVQATYSIATDGSGRRFLARLAGSGLGVWDAETADSVPLHPRAQAGVLDAAGTRAVVAWRDSLAVHALGAAASTAGPAVATGIANPIEVHISGDGRIVVVRGDSAAFAWNTQTGRSGGRVAGVGTVLAMSPDGRRLAFVEVNGSLTLADVDGRRRRRLSSDADGGSAVAAAVFTEGGRELLSYHDSGVIVRWRLQGFRRGGEVVDTVVDASAASAGRIRAVARFSEDGGILAVRLGTRPTVVWDVRRRGLLLSAAGAFNPEGRMALSRDGSRLVVSDDSTTAYTIDLSSQAWVLAACSVLAVPADAAAHGRDRVHRVCKAAMENEGDRPRKVMSTRTTPHTR